MYVELMIFPLINYADAKIGIFPDVESLLAVLTGTWFLTAGITVYLAVRHFVRTSRKRRANHGE